MKHQLTIQGFAGQVAGTFIDFRACEQGSRFVCSRVEIPLVENVRSKRATFPKKAPASINLGRAASAPSRVSASNWTPEVWPESDGLRGNSQTTDLDQ